jgi:uncharacterized Zn finger protein (UPF0148 family)
MEAKCPKCGASVKEGIKFCPKCGTAMEVPPEEKPVLKFCPKCGAPLAEGVKFCKKCGNPIGEGTAEQVVATLGATAAQASQTVKKVGNQLKEQGTASGNRKKIITGIICAVIAVIFIFGVVSLSGVTTKEVKAEEIINSYIQNPIQADKNYKHKSVKVSGRVVRKGQFTNSSDFSLCLYDTQAGGNEYTLLIDVPNKKVEEVNKIQKNDFINVEGTCIGRVPQDDRSEVCVQVQADKVSR